MAAIMAPTSYAKVVKANGVDNDTEPVIPNENLPADGAKDKPMPGSPTSKPGQAQVSLLIFLYKVKILPFL
jgi:hypothetical protein